MKMLGKPSREKSAVFFNIVQIKNYHVQVQAKTEENNGFMNDPVPFASGLGNLQTGSSSRPERSETKSQVL